MYPAHRCMILDHKFTCEVGLELLLLLACFISVHGICSVIPAGVSLVYLNYI